MIPRTYLFVPGDRPDRYGKALSAGADAVIIDLEDAVADAAKPAARAELVKWARSDPAQAAAIYVRVNSATTDAFADDLRALAQAGVGGVMLSKAESAAQAAAVRAQLPRARLIALIESARGIVELDAICAAPGVERLGFGSLDYANDLGLHGDDERALIEPSSRMAIASRVAGLMSPIAGVTTALDDADRLRADLAFARAFGFGAKLCIHPRQLPVVHDAFRPSPAEIAWARRVDAAASGGAGAVQVDGRMVDRPVMLKARDILERAQR